LRAAPARGRRLQLVEAAGFEPASGNHQPMDLHMLFPLNMIDRLPSGRGQQPIVRIDLDQDTPRTTASQAQPL